MQAVADGYDGRRRLDELYRAVGPQLLAFFRRRHASPELAEDLLQQTFAAVLRQPERLLASPSPRAYLFGVARHLSLDAYRGRRPTEPLAAEIPAENAQTADPRVEVLREAIDRLEPMFREVLELRLQQELSYQEIAVTLDIPVGTARSRLHHAVQRLRQALERRSPD